MQLRLLQRQISADPAAAERLVSSASEGWRCRSGAARARARDPPGRARPRARAGARVARRAGDGAHRGRYEARGRLPEPVELAAYFVTSEALANVGKYAHATQATVRVTRSGDRLVVEIADDGVGGADAARGSGLRGLADRVEALDGRLTVVSPPGRGHDRDRRAAALDVRRVICEACAIRVVIADDSLLVREGIASLLRRAGFEIAAEASAGR